jgi:hypothetical protein
MAAIASSSGTDYPFDMLEYDPIGHVASVESLDSTAAPRSAAATLRNCWVFNPSQ